MCVCALIRFAANEIAFKLPLSVSPLTERGQRRLLPRPECDHWRRLGDSQTHCRFYTHARIYCRPPK